MKNEILQVITGAIGTVGFGILFNIRGKRLVAAAIGGLLSWSMFLLLRLVISSEPVCYFLVAVVISLYAEILAIRMRTPTTTFITTSLLPLIPGGGLYYTMAYAFSDDGTKFAQRGIETLLLASALALGIIVVATFSKSMRKIQKRRRQALHA